MNSNLIEAVGLILLAALMNACYTLPMKLNRGWAWEHSWFAFTLLITQTVHGFYSASRIDGFTVIIT